MGLLGAWGGVMTPDFSNNPENANLFFFQASSVSHWAGAC